MPITNEGGSTIITGEAIKLYRLLALRSALSLEIKTGMKVSRGVSVLAILKREFGFKGNKAKVLAQLTAYIESPEVQSLARK